LVLILLDAPEKEWDKRVSTFLLQQAVQSKSSASKGGKAAEGDTSSRDRVNSQAQKQKQTVGEDAGTGSGSGSWPMERLRDYIAYVKATFNPSMGPEAQALLVGKVPFGYRTVYCMLLIGL
jgi:DNA replicative helicase MCM subunit Mcm2 (Cdc46/Mcm family)